MTKFFKIIIEGNFNIFIAGGKWVFPLMKIRWIFINHSVIVKYTFINIWLKVVSNYTNMLYIKLIDDHKETYESNKNVYGTLISIIIVIVNQYV